MENRNIHVYVAYQTLRIKNWREELGAPEYVKKPAALLKKDEKLPEEEQRKILLSQERAEEDRRVAYEADLAEKALTQLHTARVSRIEAVVFDFDSPEYDPAAAIPPDSCEPAYFSLRVGKESPAPGIEFLKMLQKYVERRGKLNLISRYVSWRGSEPRFLRLMVRNQTMRLRKTQLRKTYMPLYFQSTTFDWNSCVGAEKYGDTNRLITQLGLTHGLFEDPVLDELSVTLQIFARAGLAPDVDLARLIQESPVSQKASV